MFDYSRESKLYILILTFTFTRISSIIIGICFIGWGIQVESGILIKLIAFTIGGINLWRSI